MQRSIFKRYIGITMMLILISFIALGVVLMLFFNRYRKDEKSELLIQNAASIAEMAQDFLTETKEGSYELRTDILINFIDSFSESVDADIFICDLKGNILLGNYHNSRVNGIERVPQKAVKTAAEGLYSENNDLDGAYSGSFYIIGVPMLEPERDTPVGAVFAATSSATVNAFWVDSLRIFIIAAISTFLLTFCVMGVFSYRLVMPLRYMSRAAHILGSGDFSVRVPVTSADELGELAVSFNNMADSLSNSEGMRRSFIANVSHELKTPMTTIAGFIDGILDGTIPKSEQQKYLTVVSDEVKRLSRLVSSMLELSRIDSGEVKINPSSFDITETLVTTLLTFEQKIDEKKIEIRGLEDIEPQSVWGDSDLVHQVVYNLVDNAVKFTNEGGCITLFVTDGIDRTSVVIENTGPGISQDDLPVIFERFYKGDKSRSRDKYGMGLGLYLVRTILKLHGGDINVSSVENEFCRFEFYLPKQETKPRESQRAQPRIKEQKRREIKQDERSMSNDR